MKIPFIKGAVDAGKAFDTISKGIDNLAFTEQERANLNEKLADKVASFAEKTLSENTIRSKTRRYMAILLTTNIVLIVWLCIILTLFDKDISRIIELSEEFKLGIAFITVIGFHFGSYMLLNLGNKDKK